MSGAKKTYYRTEHCLQKIGGDEKEFLVESFTFKDVLSEGYVLEVRCKIAGTQYEGIYQACSSRRLKDVEFFMRRRYPDGSMLETRIAGIISSVERSLGSRPEVRELDDSFLVRIVPALELLRKDKRGGTWHNLSYADILVQELTKGLEPYGRTVRSELRETYPPVELTVRPGTESLYDFVQKLLCRTGINFWFDHSSGTETLVLCDSNEALPKGNNEKQGVLQPEWLLGSSASGEGILSLSRSAGVPPPPVEYMAFDVNAPQLSMESIPGIGGALGGFLGSLAGMAGGGGSGGGGLPISSKVVLPDTAVRVNPNDDKQFARLAQVRSDAEQTLANELEVQSTITWALAGRRCPIKTGPDEDEKEYVLRTVEASGSNLTDAPGADFQSSFKAVPTVSEQGEPLAVRPAGASAGPTEEGKHFGIFRATVIAEQNAPLDVDGMLRCRVEFPWDQQKGESKPTYVEVMQPMAGSFGGTQWFPREGDRCLVTFIGGNPEQPVILGCTYDNEFKPPVLGPPESAQRLPAASSWLGWSHASVGDKARQSMFCMDVMAGQELMFFNAPHDWRRIVARDSKEEIGRNETRSIKGKLDETVDQDYRQHVGGNRNETVDGSYTLLVKGNGNIQAAGGMTSTIKGKVSCTYEAGVTEHVQGGSVENVMGGNKSMQVNGSIKMNASQSIVARAPTVSMSSGAGGGMGAATGGALTLAQASTLSGPRSCTIESGSSRVRTDDTGAEVRGRAVALKDALGGEARLSEGKLVVDAPQGIELRCGANTLRLAPDGVYVNGARLVLDAVQTELRTTAFDIVGVPEEPTG